jgi:hypothetical protein
MALATITGAVIPAGGYLSSPADCSGSIAILRMIMPDEWDGGALTFQLSEDGVAYHDLYHVIPDALNVYEVTMPRPRPGVFTRFRLAWEGAWRSFG